MNNNSGIRIVTIGSTNKVERLHQLEELYNFMEGINKWK